jgi:hypothetical protein
MPGEGSYGPNANRRRNGKQRKIRASMDRGRQRELAGELALRKLAGQFGNSELRFQRPNIESRGGQRVGRGVGGGDPSSLRDMGYSIPRQYYGEVGARGMDLEPNIRDRPYAGGGQRAAARSTGQQRRRAIEDVRDMIWNPETNWKPTGEQVRKSRFRNPYG